MNPLGLPAPPDHWDLVESVGRFARDPAAILDQVRWELRVAAQSGRWATTPFGGEPTPPLRPGDVLALRSLPAVMDLDPDLGRSAIGAVAGLVMDAAPHWLAGDVAESVASTPTPDELGGDLRMPFPAQAVWFSAPARLPVDVCPDWLVPHGAVGDDGRTRWELGWPLIGWRKLVPTPLIPVPDLWLDGVILTATDGGGLGDLVGWVVSERTATPERSRPVRSVLLGSLRLSSLAPVVMAMASIVAWGDWVTTRGRPLSSGADRRTLRRWLRDGDPASLGAVRVLDMGHRHTDPDRPLGGHASPVTHLRRGHWRRQAIGSRDSGQREWRWISPVVVNPDGGADRRVTVWRLPS